MGAHSRTKERPGTAPRPDLRPLAVRYNPAPGTDSRGFTERELTSAAAAWLMCQVWGERQRFAIRWRDMAFDLDAVNPSLIRFRMTPDARRAMVMLIQHIGTGFTLTEPPTAGGIPPWEQVQETETETEQERSEADATGNGKTD